MKATSVCFGATNARGSIAGMTATVGRNGEAILKSKPQPSNPKTKAQGTQRRPFAFITAAWAALAAETKATWDALAQARNLQPFNVYTQANANRISRNKAPSQEPDAAEVLNPGACSALVIEDLGNGKANATATFAASANNWGVIIYAKTGADPLGVKSEILEVRGVGVADTSVTIEVPYDDGDTYSAAVFSSDGKLSALRKPA